MYWIYIYIYIYIYYKEKFRRFFSG